MKIKKDFDVVDGTVPSSSSGTNNWDNPGIEPNDKAIADTPGEKAVNDTSVESYNKASPFKKKGAGYTD